ncbi:MAG: methyltransferase domain-containing protein [Betaproteobacteria bacterium]
MRILFLSMAPLRQGPSGATSDFASARYRVLIPATHLARRGHAVQVMSLRPGEPPPEALDAQADVAIFAKSFSPSNERLAAHLRSRGIRVIVDYCDDHFEHPEHGAHFRRMAELATDVVASTQVLADSIRRHTGREASVITDPVEGPRGTPRFEPKLPALRVVWFGHPTNLVSVIDKAGDLKALAQRMPVQFTLVTQRDPSAESLASGIAALLPDRLQVQLLPWSLEGTWKVLQECDLVWIPVANEEGKMAKSPNRLLESMWAGRLVVADRMPAYEPFDDLMPLGQGLELGVAKALADPRGVEARLREAQRRIARHHSGFECGRLWARACGDDSTLPLKLNLGCGDKILPGYVNVDVVEARAGMKPDVVCDLHDLAPFSDDSAEEILSVHVVEHFWRWEVRDVLREWVRVLKPGGRMIVECPNILSACEALLANPREAAQEDERGQRSMWVLYGDPKWKDPLMIHRWGYTPESLRELMAQAGLRDVRQEPAQFKLREPRDMRIVGVK